YLEIHPPSQEINDEVFQANHSVQYKENLENSSSSNQEKEGPPQDSDIRQLIREEWYIEVCEEQRWCLDSGLSQISSLVKLASELIHGILNFSGLQYPEIHLSSQETSNKVFQANHSIQNEESFENPSDEIAVSSSNPEEPPQDSDICQLIREECYVEVPKKQKKSMEDTMLDALNSKLLLINSNSQCLDNKEQEVKNINEQPAEHGNRSIRSLQNFRVVHKSSISFNISQISSIHAAAPILSTKEPEHLLSMWYEHPNITPETESDEVTEFNAENLLPILSECEVTSEDEIECDMPANDDCSPIFTTFSNPLFNNDDLDFSDDESLLEEDFAAEEFKIYSNPLFDEDEINSDKLGPHCFNVESDFVESLLNRDTFIDFSSKFDFSGELAHVNLEIPKFDFDFEEEIRLIDNCFQDGDSQREEIDVVTSTDDVLPSSDEHDDDLSNDSLLEEVNLFLSDNLIPSGIENFADDPEGDIRFLEELLIDDSILYHESSDSYFEDNSLIPRPPPEPPDAETDTGEETPVVMNDKDEDEFSLLFTESEDTIFDPGISN
nr:hypothetical protein [Tanacetum cinerariifolium]